MGQLQSVVANFLFEIGEVCSRVSTEKGNGKKIFSFSVRILSACSRRIELRAVPKGGRKKIE